MKRNLIAILMLSISPVALRAQQAQEKKAEEQPSFPAEVELVTVDTVVTDKKGTPITGLTQGDFVVTEDGRPQGIVSFEAVQAPEAPAATPPAKPRVSTNAVPEIKTGRSFVIVFDDVHLTPMQAQRAKAAVAEFLKSGVREGDRITLISTAGDAWWTTRMEAGRDDLIAMLKRLEGRHIPDSGPDRMSDYEAMRIHVYSDQQTAERVRKRFESYGASMPSAGGQGSGQLGPGNPHGDPMVFGRASDVYYQATSRNRITLGLLERVFDSLASTRGRKSLILVSEGFIYDPNLDDFKRVLQASRRSNCAIYFLDTRGLGGMPVYFQAEFGPPVDPSDYSAMFAETIEASEGSESLAADSGGFTVKNTNDLGKGIRRIADENRVYYLLGYHPTNTARDGRFRKIKVEVKRKGISVRARKGYYAPLEGGAAKADKPPADKPTDPAFQQALDSPYERDDIPLRMSGYVFEETLLGKARALVVTDVDIRNFGFQEKDGRFADTVEFLLVVVHRETGEFFRYDQKVEMKLLPDTRQKLLKLWFPIQREFELAPGGYQAKIIVRDKNTGKMGSLIHEFEVPELAQLRVSTPIVSDALQNPSDALQGQPRPAPLARRSFASSGTLFCQYEVFGATKDKATGMPKVSAGLVVRKSDGSVLTEMAPTVINPTSIGKLSRLIGTPLDAATPGDYELVLTLKDELSGKSLEVRESFRVESPS